MSKVNVLGLDVGTNSLGWALVEHETIDSGKHLVPLRLVNSGVRIFQEGIDPKGKSRNVKRREARASRRLHQRRNRRINDLKLLSQENGLLPTNDDSLERIMREDPYKIRATGLDVQLSMFELGRAIYHIAQRRGFKSNRKTQKKEETGKVLPAISKLQKEMDSNNCRTLGEHLFKIKQEFATTSVRGEGHYTHRKMYENEFECLWASQYRFHPDKLTEGLKKRVYKTIFFQRPLKVQKNLVGNCEYEEGKKRSPRGTWYAQRFRLLQDVNNLCVIDTGTGELRELEPAERENLISDLGKKKEMTFDQIRKSLRFIDNLRFNLEESGRKKLKGNSSEWNLRQIFGKEYEGLSIERRDEIIRCLLFLDDEDVLKRHGTDRWGLDEKAISRLVKTELEPGYLHLSEKALKKMIPFLEEGSVYMDAVAKAEYERRDQRKVDVVKKLETDDLPDLPNPLVRVALHQVRKVVNAVIREYGVPEKIRVEMVRDLKNSLAKRQEVTKQQRKNERENDNARVRLQEEFGIENPSGSDILKYKLWEECGHVCPYTGKPIQKDALLSPEWEVEHILPRYRSLDNSYINKTLCASKENKNKRNRTPWEAYGHDETRWGEILKRIQRLPRAKRNRFYKREIPDDFINRQLNDTAYIAREVRACLEKVAGKNNVQIGKGRITATLRRLWGLNTLLGNSNEKNREDHRHHAVDAVVIALTSSGVIKKLSENIKKAAAHEVATLILPGMVSETKWIGGSRRSLFHIKSNGRFVVRFTRRQTMGY